MTVLTRRELVEIMTGGVAATVVAAMPPDKHPISEPVTPSILDQHLANPNEGDVLTVISDGKTWHII